jgi:hypothetical protein
MTQPARVSRQYPLQVLPVPKPVHVGAVWGVAEAELGGRNIGPNQQNASLRQLFCQFQLKSIEYQAADWLVAVH